MTYYLTIHYRKDRLETWPYIAYDTRTAVRTGRWLYEQKRQGMYAQIRNHAGMVICTIGATTVPNRRPKAAYQTEIPTKPESWKQGEIFDN